MPDVQGVEGGALMTRCTCGARAIRAYPNDTGYHSTTECIDEATGRVTPPGESAPDASEAKQ